MEKAFSSYDLAGKLLQNRTVMAPMTRSRAGNPGALATDLMATYYAQRASAGLIITEGTQPSIVGQGYPSTPGLHSAEQVESWKKVTSAVHAKGGVIFAQLMHTGRIGHKDLLPEGLVPVALCHMVCSMTQPAVHSMMHRPAPEQTVRRHQHAMFTADKRAHAYT